MDSTGPAARRGPPSSLAGVAAGAPCWPWRVSTTVRLRWSWHAHVGGEFRVASRGSDLTKRPLQCQPRHSSPLPLPSRERVGVRVTGGAPSAPLTLTLAPYGGDGTRAHDCRLGLESGVPTSSRLLVRGGLVLAGPEASPAATDILIEGDRIVRVGPDLPATPDTTVLDARDRLVIPGLVNAHTHAHNNIARGAIGALPLELW